MSFSIIIFAAIVLFLVLIFGVVISTFLLGGSSNEPKHVNSLARSQKEHNAKVIKETVEKSSYLEKVNEKVSTPEELRVEEKEASFSSSINKDKDKDKDKDKEPINIIQSEGEKIELKRKLPTSNTPPSSSSSSSSSSSKEPSQNNFQHNSQKMRGVLPKSLTPEYKKNMVYKEEHGKRVEMKQEIKDRAKVYQDPTEGICVNTRAECADNSSECFLGAGHLDLKDCIEKAERIQDNINKHNSRFGSADIRRKSDVKFISWAPADIYPDMHDPQCLIMGETANVLTDQAGWKTYVRNPASFTMTQNPSVYLVEGKCPTVKHEAFKEI